MTTEMTTQPPATAAAGQRIEDDARSFHFDVELIDGYRQRVNFELPAIAPFDIDEPPPLGELAGPNPARVLAAAIASCLGASLRFCLGRARIDVHGLRTRVEGTMTRNERGRLRVGRISVQLQPVVAAEDQPRMARCVEVFEDFCVVTASVRPAIAVDVNVVPVAPGTTD